MTKRYRACLFFRKLSGIFGKEEEKIGTFLAHSGSTARPIALTQVSASHFMLKLWLKIFYMIGIALSEELSCTWTGLAAFEILFFFFFFFFFFS